MGGGRWVVGSGSCDGMGESGDGVTGWAVQTSLPTLCNQHAPALAVEGTLNTAAQVQGASLGPPVILISRACNEIRSTVKRTLIRYAQIVPHTGTLTTPTRSVGLGDSAFLRISIHMSVTSNM